MYRTDVKAIYLDKLKYTAVCKEVKKGKFCWVILQLKIPFVFFISSLQKMISGIIMLNS